SETVTITITPRDAGTAVVGYGLDISISAATGNGTLGTLIDLGDGSYQVNYTSSSATSSDTLTFTVNGVELTDTVVITW
ncbi:MAG: hypothetical protein GY806_16510, partial [Gammaproteobacteria bacterium]|nr:hypothetical protein [Gammaproteobacteria bacterium]